MSFPELTAGQTIAERYRLLALRGSGAMGSVWRAARLSDGSECALKLLHRTREDRADASARFLREARAASAIASPHAVRVLDFGIAGETPFIAMELLEGETLAARLAREGALSALETSRIVGQIAAALEHAHALGIVHRDLKPDNVFLVRGAHGVVAKVLDFGIAKMEDEGAGVRDLTESGALLGTPRYMSPEQIEGARYVDFRSDLWSLGVIACECLIARRPFDADGLRALFLAICVHPLPVPSQLGRVPSGFDAWFATATARDPEQRHRSVRALAAELRRICEREPAAGETADEPEPGAVATPDTAVLPARTGRTSVRIGRRWSWVAAALLACAAGVWWSQREARAEVNAPASGGIAPALRGGAARSVAAAQASMPPEPRAPAARPVAAVPAAAEPAIERASSAPAGGVAEDSPNRERGARRERGAAAGREATPARVWDVETMLRDRK